MSKTRDEYTQKLKNLESIVLPKYIQLREKRGETQEYNILSLNSTINVRVNEFAKIKERTYATADELLDVYCYELSKREDDILYDFLKDRHCWEYFEIFIRRYFLRKQNELSKKKPKEEMYELWFGDNNNCYGLMITPVYRYSFKEKRYIWENDKSEIRKVGFHYWSIAHVLETGLIDKEKDENILFSDVESIITFYKNIFYDKTQSKYEKAIMLRYFELLRTTTDYDNVAFLIPELRLLKEKEHKYRLDFTVSSAEDITRNIGFELSPDSTHAYTQNIEQKNYTEILREEIQRWEKEIGKRNDYYEKFNIHVKTFMEKDLQDIDECFEIMKRYICFEENEKGSWEKLKEKLENEN